MTSATGKPPTVQGINALLARAGFDRAETVGRSRSYHAHTAGFHVRKYPGGVIVNWWPDTTSLATAHTSAQAEKERRTQREAVQRYAEAIEAAGWSIKVTLSLGTVTVYPKPETP